MNTRKVTSSIGSNSNSTESARDNEKFKADRHEGAEARAALIASIMVKTCLIFCYSKQSAIGNTLKIERIAGALSPVGGNDGDNSRRSSDCLLLLLTEAGELHISAQKQSQIRVLG